MSKQDPRIAVGARHGVPHVSVQMLLRQLVNRLGLHDPGLRCLAELRGKREEVDIPLLCPIPSRKIQFELELGEILSQSLSYFPQILFLALARLGGRVKMHGKTFVPGAVLMLNEDQPFDLMVVDEEPEPPPACPGKLRKVLN